jgi:hypothetical protein
MWLEGLSTRQEIYTILVGQPERRRALGESYRKLKMEDDIKVDLNKMRSYVRGSCGLG